MWRAVRGDFRSKSGCRASRHSFLKMEGTMKVGDAVEIDVYGKWIAGKVSDLQKDGTVKAVVDAPEHDLHGRELICDSTHIREKSVDSESGAVLHDAPNGHAFHS
jgi:hypothetical protein